MEKYEEEGEEEEEEEDGQQCGACAAVRGEI